MIREDDSALTELMMSGNDEFDELCRLEPELQILYALALACPAHAYYSPTDVWCRRFKPRLLKLVGWYAEIRNPALHTSEAYDTAYQCIVAAIPEWDNAEHADEEDAYFDEDQWRGEEEVTTCSELHLLDSRIHT